MKKLLFSLILSLLPIASNAIQYEYFNPLMQSNAAVKVNETVGVLTPPEGKGFGVLSALTNLQSVNSSIATNEYGIQVDTLGLVCPTEDAVAAAISAHNTDQSAHSYIQNRITVNDNAIAANADAIQKTREDFMAADAELQTQITSYAGELTTLRNDLDDLGDEVAVIEGKIPASTTSSNQLVNASQLTAESQDIRSEFAQADSELQTQITAQAGSITTLRNDTDDLGDQVAAIEGKIPATASTSNQLAVNSQITTLQTNLTNGLALKLDKNQGSENANKILTVGTDGQITLSSAPGSGLLSVSHDATLTGSGTDASPLGIASTVLSEIADKADQTVVDALSSTVSGIQSDYVSKTATAAQTIVSSLQTPELTVGTTEGTLNLSITAGVATIATNNGLDIISQTKFDTSPTTDDKTTWANALDASLVNKAQVASAIEEIPTGANLPILTYMWADHILNDVSWLRADTFSWQSGDVYVAAYQHLAGDIDGKTLQSETIGDTTIQFYLADDGHKICPASEESNVSALYESTGIAWYYIIDTTNQRFKLPRTKKPETDYIPDFANQQVVTMPFTAPSDGWFIAHAVNVNAVVYVNGVSVAQGNWYSGKWSGNLNSQIIVKKGDVVTGAVGTMRFIPFVKPNYNDKNEYKYLYFYVGNFTQTALENTAGLNTELFNQKMDNGTPLARDIFSPDEWVGGAAENILSAGVGSNTITFTKNWQEYDYLWFSSVSDGSSTYDDSPHWVSVKWLLSRAAAGDTNLAIIRYASGAYWYVNPQTWTETTMPLGGGAENLYINRVYAIKLKNITAQNVGLLNYKGLFETAAALVATVPTAMGQWAIVSNDETQNNLQTKYFSTKDVNGNFVWAFGGVIDSSLVGADYVVESQMPTAENNYTWYRKYKSGWVEQGGFASNIAWTGQGASKAITLPIVMNDINYTVSATMGKNNTSWNYPGCRGFAESTTQITVGVATLGNGQGTVEKVYWQVSGMAAQ